MKHTYSPERDIKEKKKLLSDFGFCITAEIELLLTEAKTDVERENLVLGLLHKKFDKKEQLEKQTRVKEAKS